MKHLLATLAAALLGAGVCFAQTDPERLFAAGIELERGGKGPEAVKVYMRAAREGNGKAATRLGEIYSTGIPGVERDYANSVMWHNAARAMGEQGPSRETAQMRRLEELQAARSRREIDEARRLAEEDARRRDEAKKDGARVMPPVLRSMPGDAQFERGKTLEREGRGPQAVQRYARAAREGNAKAARRLAEIYDKGTPGIERDYPVSVQWEHVARLLAGGRPADITASRALLEEAGLLEGLGKASEAVPLYERAARAGSGKAAMRLGEIYEKGVPGVRPDQALSVKWHGAARMLREDAERTPR